MHFYLFLYLLCKTVSFWKAKAWVSLIFNPEVITSRVFVFVPVCIFLGSVPKALIIFCKGSKTWKIFRRCKRRSYFGTSGYCGFGFSLLLLKKETSFKSQIHVILMLVFHRGCVPWKVRAHGLGRKPRSAFCFQDSVH